MPKKEFIIKLDKKGKLKEVWGKVKAKDFKKSVKKLKNIFGIE